MALALVGSVDWGGDDYNRLLVPAQPAQVHHEVVHHAPRARGPGTLSIRLSSVLFHQLTVKKYVPPTSDEPPGRDESTRRFFGRFGSPPELEGKSVLDIGCSLGLECVEAAQRGASRVVGIDIRGVEFARARLATQHPELRDRVEFVSTDGSLAELGVERFDVVLSKDSMEHYDDPESFIAVMAGFLKPDGELFIGFGPLWKSPTGGHIEFMTRVPWAHLIFPESVVLAERRRFRPRENPRHFEEIAGGLNKMTLDRFRTIMASSGLECRYFETNVSDNPIVKAMTVASRVSPIREYFTANVYGVWRKPNAESSSAEAA
jgi:SAM-dependent methyltransferase